MNVTVEQWATPPRVRIDTTATSVSRVEDGVPIPVRGDVVGGVIYDYECPQETPVAYTDGTATISAEMPDVGVWIIPPGRPELAAQMPVNQGGFSGWSRAAVSSSLTIPGRTNPITKSFSRSGRTGKITGLVLSADDFATLSACLDVAGPMFLSFPSSQWPAFGLVSWVTIGDVQETPLEDLTGRQTWTVGFDVTPTDRPDSVTVDIVTWETQPATWAADIGTWGS
jgi:hypothetical protein